MIRVLRILSSLVNVYMLLISIRVILTWFSGMGSGGVLNTLRRITDPYLDWFRRFTFLRAGFLDLSPIAALGVLSLVQRILFVLASHGRISVGIILALILQGVWSAVSFILGFLIVVLILRLVAHYFARNSYSPFWNIVDTISKPVLYRINRVLFKNRIPNFVTALIVSIAVLVLIYIALKLAVFFAAALLAGLPV